MHALTRLFGALALLLVSMTSAFAGSVNLAWDAVNDPRVSGYKVYYGTSSRNYTGQVDVGNATTRTISNLIDGATYYFAVTVYDASRVESGYSNEVVGTVPAAASDTTPPTAPGSLAATPSGTSTINLSWTASTDTVGVTGYRVERCQGASCTNFAQIATPTATTYSSTGLTAGTSYRYRVRAVDAAGNLSAYSSIATATTAATADTTAPTTPTGLTAIASSSTGIYLSWTASTDNVGVTGYRVDRCQGTTCTAFGHIATPTGTSFSDTGRTPGTTYRYRVRATDAAGNLSAYSSIATSTTPVLALRNDVDFDANLDADLVWRHAGMGTTSIWLVNNGAKQSGADLMGDANWSVTHAGDFDGDGKSDLIWRNTVTGVTAMWRMNGAALVQGATLLTDPSWRVVHVADFNGDGKSDLIWRNSVTGVSSMWLMSGTQFAAGVTLMTSPAWVVALTGDFNGDDKADLLWRNTATGAAAVWLMSGTTMTSGTTVLLTPGWVPLHAADFDGDGRDDLIWNNPVTGETSMWLMNGLQRTAGATLIASPDWDATLTGDMDGDGRADLVWRNSVTGTTALWLMNGTTRLQGVTLLSNSPWVATQVGDYNGDARADLAWRNSVTGATALWLMNGASIISAATLVTDPGWSLVPLH